MGQDSGSRAGPSSTEARQRRRGQTSATPAPAMDVAAELLAKEEWQKEQQPTLPLLLLQAGASQPAAAAARSGTGIRPQQCSEAHTAKCQAARASDPPPPKQQPQSRCLKIPRSQIAEVSSSSAGDSLPPTGG